MRWISIAFLMLALITACVPNPPTATATPANVVPSVAPSAVVTATLAAPGVTPAPTNTTPPQATATLPAIPTATPTTAPVTTTAPVGPNVTQAAPDCKLLPGFPTCGLGLPLSGKLAIYDEARQVIQVLDFNAKQDLLIKPKAGTTSLAWLDKGNFLAATGSDNQKSLAWTNPVTSKTPDLPGVSPQGQPVFKAADGSTAWLERKETGSFFHVRAANSAQEQVWPAEAQVSDKIHELLGWAPGTKLLLAGYYFAGNSMWNIGYRLYTVDTRTGAVTDLKASMLIGSPFAWHPSQAGLMVFSDTSDTYRLAVLDMTTAKVTHPISDEVISSSSPIWTPDGSAILHAARGINGDPPAANDPFALPGIYRTEWPAGTTTRITTPPQSQRDSWPQPEADGKNFLFVRYNPVTRQGEVRLAGMDGKLDMPVVTGLNLDRAIQKPIDDFWPNVLAYTP